MISVRPFGTTANGEKAQLFLLENDRASVYVTDFGAHLVAFNVPDRNGVLTDVILGFDDVLPYSGDVGSIGATVGRHANRIENGRFTLNGVTYQLAVNNGPNHLHGGLVGFNHRLFKAFPDGDTLRLRYTSPDGEEGYPGTLDFEVAFTLDGNELILDYTAVTDQDTVVNFTNHAYYNLDGALSDKPIYDQWLTVYADEYCAADKNCLATGEILSVKGNEMDFRTPTRIGDRLERPVGAIQAIGGIDHNFVLSAEHGQMKQAATLYSPKTGIALDCFTDQPGIQIYTGNFTDQDGGKGMTHYGKHGAVCLETQHFPNAMAHPDFPSVVLKAGETFSSRTIYSFSVREVISDDQLQKNRSFDDGKRRIFKR